MFLEPEYAQFLLTPHAGRAEGLYHQPQPGPNEARTLSPTSLTLHAVRARGHIAAIELTGN